MFIIADLSELLPHIPDALRVIIASELVPPYASVQSAQEDTGKDQQQQQQQNGSDDASALLTERQQHTPAVPRSRYIQLRVGGGPDDGVDAVPDDDASSFTYNCTAGMIFRETTV